MGRDFRRLSRVRRAVPDLDPAGRRPWFSAVSPWADRGASATTLGISAAVWLAVTQIIAAGLGGYLAGRLRARWVNTHGDEVYFRDTAHGFLSWAIATLVTVALVASSAGSLIGGTAKAGAQAVGAAGGAAGGMMANGARGGDPYGYFIDTLFRDDRPVAVSDDAAHSVVARIFAKTLSNGGQLAPEDRTYLAQLVSQRTNLSQQQAEQRVDQVYQQARQSVEDAKVAAQKAADAAAKAAATAALWTFVALLCGAFSPAWPRSTAVAAATLWNTWKSTLTARPCAEFNKKGDLPCAHYFCFSSVCQFL